jgi:hypothetical protein
MSALPPKADIAGRNTDVQQACDNRSKSFVRHNAAVVVARPVSLGVAVIACVPKVLVGREQEAVPETIVVAIVKAITVMIRFATSHPIKTGINGTAKGPAGPASHSGAIETALWAGRPQAATQIAAADTPADVSCTAAGKAAATAKAAAVTATAKAVVTAAATSTGKTISDSKSCEKNSDRSRSYYLIARH